MVFSAVLIQMELYSLIYTITDGIATAGGMVLGKKLGAGKTAKVKYYMKLSAMNVIAVGIVMPILVYIFREPLSRIYTSGN